MGIMSDYHGPRYPRYPSRHHIDDEDEDTLYRDDESYLSDAESIFSDTSSVFRNKPRMTRRQSFTQAQPANKDPRKHVFECWKLSVVPARKEVTNGTKVLGVNFTDWDHIEGEVTKVGVAMNQSELSEMYHNAVAIHEAQSRRSWPVRIVRGKAKSYEQELEKRCDRLPLEVKDSINDLLSDKGDSSSSAYRQRTWTVVYMEERYAHRFTRTQGAKIKPQKIRFWKKSKTQKPTEYHIIIRGAETGLAERREGYDVPSEFSNPWFEFDGEERRSRRLTRVNRRRARSVSRPRDRSRYRRFEVASPSPRRPPPRNPSRDSYMSGDNYSWRPRDDDNYAPREPELRSRPRVFGPTPVYNRPAPRPFPPAPTPPESFTPPPGVSQFRPLPRFPPPPPPPADWSEENPFGGPRYPNPFLNAGPCPPYASWNNNHVPPPPPIELPSGGLANNWTVGCAPPPPPPPGLSVPPLSRTTPFPRLKSFCQACKSARFCGHFPGLHCDRAVQYEMYPGIGYVESHPKCSVCHNLHSTSRSQEAFGAGHPTGYAYQSFRGRPPPPMCEDLYEDEDNATVLDDDDDNDVASVHSDEVKEDKHEDDEDTQVEELFEAPANEQKEA